VVVAGDAWDAMKGERGGGTAEAGAEEEGERGIGVFVGGEIAKVVGEDYDVLGRQGKEYTDCLYLERGEGGDYYSMCIGGEKQVG